MKLVVPVVAALAVMGPSIVLAESTKYVRGGDEANVDAERSLVEEAEIWNTDTTYLAPEDFPDREDEAGFKMMAKIDLEGDAETGSPTDLTTIAPTIAPTVSVSATPES